MGLRDEAAQVARLAGQMNRKAWQNTLIGSSPGSGVTYGFDADAEAVDFEVLLDFFTRDLRGS